MKKITAIIIFPAIIMILIATKTTSVLATNNNFVVQNIQITTNPQYDRDPSFFRAPIKPIAFLCAWKRCKAD